MYVVVCWVQDDLMDKKRVVGPFPTEQDADEWINAQPEQPRSASRSWLASHFRYRYSTAEVEAAEAFAWR